MVTTFSSGCGLVQSPRIEWLLAFGPVTNILFFFSKLIGKVRLLFFNKTIDLRAISREVFLCSLVNILLSTSSKSIKGFSNNPNLIFANNIFLTDSSILFSEILFSLTSSTTCSKK
ncbi:MAG: Uncharacterised protein [Crocinitomicaceae bacterium]|nr:MAG: Uncharacterised protein [Crocinitomicaceae bacterium]